VQRLKLFRDFNLRHHSLGNGQFFHDRNIAGGRNASAILAVLAIAEHNALAAENVQKRRRSAKGKQSTNKHYLLPQRT
jgi:hypothetical protein